MRIMYQASALVLSPATLFYYNCPSLAEMNNGTPAVQVVKQKYRKPQIRLG